MDRHQRYYLRNKKRILLEGKKEIYCNSCEIHIRKASSYVHRKSKKHIKKIGYDEFKRHPISKRKTYNKKLFNRCVNELIYYFDNIDEFLFKIKFKNFEEIDEYFDSPKYDKILSAIKKRDINISQLYK